MEQSAPAECIECSGQKGLGNAPAAPRRGDCQVLDEAGIPAKSEADGLVVMVGGDEKECGIVFIVAADGRPPLLEGRNAAEAIAVSLGEERVELFGIGDGQRPQQDTSMLDDFLLFAAQVLA